MMNTFWPFRNKAHLGLRTLSSMLVIVSMLLLTMTLPGPLTVSAQPLEQAGWVQQWADEFNGTGGVNTGNWIYDTGTSYPGGPANWGTGEVQSYSSSTSNVFQSGGSLNIRALHSGSDPVAGWTSGRIETQRADFQPPAGGQMAVEARVQLPNVSGAAAQGYWPAFWMLGVGYRGNYWNWPGIGEIDILENINGVNQWWGTLHCGTSPGGPCNETTGLGGTASGFSPSLQTAYHTYRIEYDRSVSPEQIRWYVDGIQRHIVYSNQVDATTWSNATNHGFFILFNVAIGGGWPGNPTGSTASGGTMLVDYVRVFYASSGPTITNTPTNTPTRTPTQPPGGLPSPWQHQDVGAVGLAGSATYSSGSFTIDGGGADIWGAADEFHYVYQTLTGDGTITARVVSLENTNGWAKAGVMIRESLAANSKHAMMVLTPSNGLSFQRRTTTGGTSASTSGGAATAPRWVRMVRSGSTFTAYSSTDGVNWTTVGSASITMGSSVTVGLAVTAHNDATLATAVFDNVSVTGGGPTPTFTPTPTRTNTPPPGGRDAYATIQAESYDAQFGTQTETTSDTGGGLNVAYIANGDWLQYNNVNFGSTSPTTVQARVASGAAGGVSGSVEFHLDSLTGPTIGSFSIANTGGWQSWTTVPANISGATGTHNLYIVFKSGQPADFANLNWFVFVGTTPTPTKTNTPFSPTSTPTATTPPSGTNLALNKPATASASCNTNETASKAVNGSVSGGNSDKWCDNTSASKWLRVDLGASYNITQFIVRHAGAGGESTAWNTSAYNIQLSNDGSTWSTVVTVSGNTANVTTNNIASTSGRYARLNVTNAGSDGVARIYEFEVYSSGSGPTPTPGTVTCTSTGPTGTFPMCFQNNTGGAYADSQVYVTILGMASPGQWYYLKADGTAAHINYADTTAPGHLTKNGVNYPNMSFSLAQTRKVTIPTRWEGGRAYVSLGSPMYIPVSPDNMGWGGPDLHNPNDPNADVYYDWYEFTYVYGAIPFGGNTTQVDQFSFPMTARLQQASSGYDQTVGITLSRSQVRSQYLSYVGPAFDPLQNAYRIIAPRSSNDFAPGGSQANYMQAYIDQTWNYYTANQFTLTRLNQTFTGRVSGATLTFTKDGAGPFVLQKPTTKDVVECSGALASPGMSTTALELGAEFCAAFNRGVAMNTALWWGSPTAYYPAGGIKNDYAGFFHTIGLQGRAYGFPYDDINDQSSVKILGNSNPPSAVTIGIGW